MTRYTPSIENATASNAVSLGIFFKKKISPNAATTGINAMITDAALALILSIPLFSKKKYIVIPIMPAVAIKGISFFSSFSFGAAYFIIGNKIILAITNL
ncbi:hypothetical protein SDC9_182477 [bioreactor metagenome]|uniref:Uncharacterized protein n=1 Tax=bioreactor metagenome TaxID=1076179 RepID=A0A645HH37_9ZZZZ